MINKEKKYELIKFNDGEFSLDVNVSPDEDTVWLTLDQIAILFDRDRSVIGKHIKNILKDEELSEKSVRANFAHTALDGKIYNTDYYNLDIIISVGYRVKSRRGILFRKWANSILKQYLLKGYAINEDRLSIIQNRVMELENNNSKTNNRLDNIEKAVFQENSHMFFEGEILEPYTFLRKLFFLARDSITIVDLYADKFLISMLNDIKVNITIIVSSSSYLNKENIPNNITIIHNDIIHDRFIFIDNIAYAIGTSFNEIGKKRFIIMKLNNITKEMILKGII